METTRIAKVVIKMKAHASGKCTVVVGGARLTKGTAGDRRGFQSSLNALISLLLQIHSGVSISPQQRSEFHPHPTHCPRSFHIPVCAGERAETRRRSMILCSALLLLVCVTEWISELDETSAS